MYSYIFIDISMLELYFRHRYQFCNILHDVTLGSCLKKSVCHVALSYDVEDILLCIAGGKSDGGAVLCVTDADD